MTTNGIQILTLSLDISKTESLLSTISIITTVAGTGAPGGYVEGTGPATSATLNEPYGVTLDVLGNFYIADTDNHVIRLVNKISGLITTVAGTGGLAGYAGDAGPATSAKLSSPRGIALDALGNFYIADTGNNVIRLVTKISGFITTVAGTGLPGGYAEGTGPATSATLYSPSGVALDVLGNLYIADTGYHVIRLVNKISGLITTVAGTGGLAGYAGDAGPATSAKLSSPSGVALDALGNFYIADTYNQRIRLVDRLLLSSTPTSPPTVYPSSLVPKARKSTSPSPKAIKIPKAPRAPKCDKTKTCVQEISEVEVNDILVNSVVSEFPALRRL